MKNQVNKRSAAIVIAKDLHLQLTRFRQGREHYTKLTNFACWSSANT